MLESRTHEEAGALWENFIISERIKHNAYSDSYCNSWFWRTQQQKENREAYDRSKIEAGVLRACHKRPVSAQQITTLVDEVENEIFNREEREIPSGTIGELVMNKLKDLDAVAYVRFASVYREFKDVNTFMDELKSVLNDKNPM